MRRIKAGLPPASITQFRATGATYRQLSGVRAIRKLLLDEQGGVCAYCERPLRLREGEKHRTKIEHFHPRHLSKAASLLPQQCGMASGASSALRAQTEWTNMLLCCDGGQRPGTGPRTCDTKKDRAHICERFRNPKNVPAGAELLVRIDPLTGRAVAANWLPAGAQEVIDDVLNLNADQLIRARLTRLEPFLAELRIRKAKLHGMTTAQRRDHSRAIRDMAAAPGFEFRSAVLSIASALER